MVVLGLVELEVMPRALTLSPVLADPWAVALALMESQKGGTEIMQRQTWQLTSQLSLQSPGGGGRGGAG